ncbi:right-handed parallel beta-helix repeat-containing protein [Cerasicoccus fimbriatus]|uniref:right-handed parallel beta-helix repeat-containing protein n=1 Tax=Cerasicoccus fimbriatus TaxID=3014554 RepID=UPI0022B2B0CB|nr:right-handed parallel beta-helix repeat-containing protein [Cerasicoccus sp. TK19100]
MKNRLLTVALSLAALTQLNAADYYMTPTGASSQDGSDWANALPKTELATTLNTTMGPGDTLYLGSGDYGSSSFSLASNGSAGSPKSIIGVDTGSGLPYFSGDPTWTRTNPDNGKWQIITVKGDYWVVENLELSHVRYGIKNTNSDTANHVTFRNIKIHNVRHGVYLSYVDNATFENLTVQEYTKHAYRLDRGCDNVTFIDCLADMTAGDTSWWDHAESFPFGFVVYNGGTANSNVVFDGCVAMDNRRNNQGISYWNGDGFVVEGNTSGTTEFIGCISLNNEDAGYDIKAAATFVDCVSVANYRGYRLWHTTKTLENCVATFPYRRSTGTPAGDETGSGVWTQNGSSTLSNFTFHGNAGTAAHEDGSGSLSFTDSILSFSGASGSFTSGSVTLGAGTVTYRPGSGTDPDFVNASDTWNGIGNAMNSQTYTDTKGYYSGAATPPATAGVISVNLSDSVNTILSATDVVGVLPVANWNNTTVNNESLTNLTDDTGAATTADVDFTNTAFYYSNSTPAQSAPLDDDAKMMTGTRAISNGSSTAAAFYEIPYEKYDVYVYWGGHSSGQPVPAEMSIALQAHDGSSWVTQETRYMLDTDRQWDGSYNESTATTSGVATDGNEYVVFRNVTLDSIKIRGTCDRRTGFNAIQIVENTEEVLVVGDTIGMNLANAGAELASTDVAGYIPMPNWNNTTANNETLTDVVDDSGTATSVDISFSNTPYYYTNATPTYSAPYEADSLLMRGTRAMSNASSTAATVTDIPYATYDVYVYWGGRKTGETVPAEMKVEFQTDVGGTWTTQETRYMLDTDHEWDGTYEESTATTTGTAVDGEEFVVFRDQTASSFKLRGTCGRRTGINAFQIVEK